LSPKKIGSLLHGNAPFLPLAAEAKVRALFAAGNVRRRREVRQASGHHRAGEKAADFSGRTGRQKRKLLGTGEHFHEMVLTDKKASAAVSTWSRQKIRRNSASGIKSGAWRRS